MQLERFGLCVILLLGACTSTAHKFKNSTNPTAERITDCAMKLQMLAGAASAWYTFVDIPFHGPVGRWGIRVEGYQRGEARLLGEHLGVAAKPPEDDGVLKICVTLREHARPNFQRDSSGTIVRVVGTGSYELGDTYYLTRPPWTGWIGGRGSTLIKCSDFDVSVQGGQDCTKLPFRIVPNVKDYRLVPAVVYFPEKFDVESVSGSVKAQALPDGTIVVYAVLRNEPGF